MRTIWKFTLGCVSSADTVTSLQMPVGAEVISCQRQGDDIVLWARVHTDAAKECRKFAVYGTGWEILPILGKLEHLGTVQFDEGSLVLHVFEIK